MAKDIYVHGSAQVTARNTGDAPEKLAIAQQVVVSAGEILVAAGFERDEIASFFRQAADQLAGGDASSEESLADGSPSAAAGFDQLKADFRSSAPVRELAGLETQAASYALAKQDQAALRDVFELAMKMVPHIADAQHWLRKAANEAGLRVFANRRDVLQHQPDEEIGLDGNAIFFEDFEATYARCLGTICSVIDALADQGDHEAFAFLLESLFENGVVVSFDIKEALENGVATLATPPAAADAR